MANSISLASGTSIPIGVALQDDSTPPEAINLATMTEMVWQVLDAAQRIIIKKYYTTSGILVIGDPTEGNIQIGLNADDTSPAFGVGSTTKIMDYTFELRLYFGEALQEITFTGDFIVTPTTTWGASVQTPLTKRRVIVQGRF
jgi:hypothetical protein